MQNTEKLNVSAETIARTICLVLALINQILAILGKGSISIADDQVYQYVSIAFTVATAIWAWWKNNSFTQPALRADATLKMIKGDE